MLFCSYVIFLLRDQWLIEKLPVSEAMGAALVSNNFSPIPSKFSFHMKKKKWLVAAQKLQSIKTLLTLELSQYRKSSSIFLSSEAVAASSDCCCVHILNSLENPALRHSRDFNIATAHRPCEAIQVSIRITTICSRDTRSCSRRIYVEY